MSMGSGMLGSCRVGSISRWEARCWKWDGKWEVRRMIMEVGWGKWEVGRGGMLEVGWEIGGVW